LAYCVIYATFQARPGKSLFVIGRKNWLFSDTGGGATASANLYSLIETAKANGIEPYRYLCALFAVLPKASRLKDYEALLPWHIALPSQ
jgi:hypothetical protein